jgi:hypothetical protein
MKNNVYHNSFTSDDFSEKNKEHWWWHSVDSKRLMKAKRQENCIISVEAK